MICLFSVNHFDYNLLLYYMQYVPGDIYINFTVGCLSEIAAFILSGFLYKILGPRLSLILSFAFAALGGFCIAFVPQAQGYLIAGFIFVAKFGIAFAFNAAYIITPTLFPISFRTTAYGYAFIFGNFITIFAPEFAKIAQPVPMLFYGSTCVLASVVSFFLVTNVSYE